MPLTIFVAGISGLLFGLGLIVAGMADPAKVLAFLDLAGKWNPSLAFVMVGAIGIAIIPFAWARQRKTSLLGLEIQLPTQTKIDSALVVGSLLFGIGWGLAGICPGPALVLLGSGIGKGAVFVVAMLAGIVAVD
ncbi:MAG: YeeE/YedE family protein, partial [Undibacterium sp.]|nr:YeeE/YedE family protein [Undibacterium sp.]